MSQFLKPDHG